MEHPSLLRAHDRASLGSARDAARRHQALRRPDADPARRLDQGHAAGSRGRRDPAQMRALRLLPRDLPHLQPAGRRARQPARAHLPHEADARGRAGHAAHAAAPRPLRHLPRVRDHMSLRRGIRAPRGHRPRPGGEEGAAHAVGPAAPLVSQEHPAVARRVRRGARARPPLQAGAADGARAPDPGAARARRRSRRAACAAHAGAGRLRAAVDGALDQRGGGARPRPHRHLARGRSARRLLRRGHLPPQLPGRGAQVREGQHRRVVAACRRRAPRRS